MLDPETVNDDLINDVKKCTLHRLAVRWGVTDENFLLALRCASRIIFVGIGRETHRQGQRIKLKCIT